MDDSIARFDRILHQTVQNASVALPLDVGRSNAAGSALVPFWRQSEQVWSLTDLLMVMGILRSGIYAASIDESRLVIVCLEVCPG